jgi:hypothetical protein
LDHRLNSGGIDHCSQFSVSIPVIAALVESSQLRKKFELDESSQADFQLISDLCATFGWSSGDLLDTDYSAVLKQRAIFAELKIKEKIATYFAVDAGYN